MSHSSFRVTAPVPPTFQRFDPCSMKGNPKYPENCFANRRLFPHPDINSRSIPRIKKNATANRGVQTAFAR
ncbi:hypothetical protein [Caballeronia sp. LZ035]|uniref:hypothetical protein n=1 Tax=Caballeronia sp. LZ035 TaxID=3038568 RepID=UPI002863DFE1|nr:hypothetical protein [Caballeronia sp. LZ035]MDR5756416.1 hypothetical protein [Caballeronia sp. LZ035]